MKLRILDRPRDIGPNFNRVTPTLYPDEVQAAADACGFCGECGKHPDEHERDCTVLAERESERLETRGEFL